MSGQIFPSYVLENIYSYLDFETKLRFRRVNKWAKKCIDRMLEDVYKIIKNDHIIFYDYSDSYSPDYDFIKNYEFYYSVDKFQKLLDVNDLEVKKIISLATYVIFEYNNAHYLTIENPTKKKLLKYITGKFMTEIVQKCPPPLKGKETFFHMKYRAKKLFDNFKDLLIEHTNSDLAYDLYKVYARSDMKELFSFYFWVDPIYIYIFFRSFFPAIRKFEKEDQLKWIPKSVFESIFSILNDPDNTENNFRYKFALFCQHNYVFRNICIKEYGYKYRPVFDKTYMLTYEYTEYVFTYRFNHKTKTYYQVRYSYNIVLRDIDEPIVADFKCDITRPILPEGAIIGNIFGNIKEAVHGEINGRVLGHIYGPITGSIYGAVMGSIRGPVSGNIYGYVSGNIFSIIEKTATIYADIGGDITNDIYGVIKGNVNRIFGNIYGDIYGDVLGNIVGNVHGTIYGNVHGSIRGNNYGHIYGKIYNGLKGVNYGKIFSN